MAREYIVVRNGLSKDKNKPYSIAYALIVSEKKNCSFLNEKDKVFVDGQRAVGSTVLVEQTVVG